MKNYLFTDDLTGGVVARAPTLDAALQLAWSFAATHPDDWRAHVIRLRTPVLTADEYPPDSCVPQPRAGSWIWTDIRYRVAQLWIAAARDPAYCWAKSPELLVSADFPSLALALFELRNRGNTTDPRKLEYKLAGQHYGYKSIGSLLDEEKPAKLTFIDQAGLWRTLRPGRRSEAPTLYRRRKRVAP